MELEAESQAEIPTWEQIVERHSDRVFRLAYRSTGNRHDAEDLTQEVFVRVFRSLSTYTPGTFEGWLHRITTNLFLDQARRKQRIRFDALSDERAERLTSTHADAGHRLRGPDLRRRHRARARDAAAGLPGRRRAVRRRRAQLRGDRRDPGRQARHRAIPDPPRPGDAAHRARPPRPERRTGPLRGPRHRDQRAHRRHIAVRMGDEPRDRSSRIPGKRPARRSDV